MINTLCCELEQDYKILNSFTIRCHVEPYKINGDAHRKVQIKPSGDQCGCGLRLNWPLKEGFVWSAVSGHFL